MKRRREHAAVPELQLDDQERQKALARRRSAALDAKRSAKLKARQLHEDELRADKEDELRLRLGLELQRAELEQQVQRKEARRLLNDVQQKADQGRAQRRITANANARRIPSIFAGVSRCCSRASPSTISPT